jgi:DNA-binding CsgD family transcriptional regulator
VKNVADEEPAAVKRKVNKAQTTLKFIAIAFHAEVRRKRWLTGLVDGVALTPREIECLQWSVQGKSKGDIACILGIRRSTVVFHLENAKRKLGVRVAAQAVARFAASD